MKSKVKLILYIIVVLSIFCTVSNAEGVSEKQGYLYINNTLIEAEDGIVVKEKGAILLPFRTILESLGATVEWNEKTGDTVVRYNEHEYVSYIKDSAYHLSDAQYFYIKNLTTNKNIFLSDMSLAGAFEMINDRIYLHRDTASRMIQAMGCDIDIDFETKTVKILDEKHINSEVNRSNDSKTVSIETPDDNLYVFCENEKYGFMDSDGEIIIEPQFDIANDFCEGLAVVGKYKHKDRGASGVSDYSYGYINTLGEFVIPYKYDVADDFHEGAAVVAETNQSKRFFIDKTGKNLFDNTYQVMQKFSNGYAPVSLETELLYESHFKVKKWTFIDKTGNECGHDYTSVDEFIDELTFVTENEVQKIINTDFETVFELYKDAEYTLKNNLGSGYFEVRKDDKLGVINSKGDIIIDCIYNNIWYNDGIFTVRKDGVKNKFGYVYENGDIMLEPIYNLATEFSYGVAAIEVEANNWSLINKNGEVIVKNLNYDFIQPTKGGLFRVSDYESGGIGYIDIHGNKIR